MKIIDLRSDTVTKPTNEMREAMYNAVVGDDVYGDDPTVKELEKLAAEITGKEAALFVPSGTFGNQLALLTHTNRADEVILEATSHIKWHEVGGAALIAGVMLHTINGEMGKMDPNDIKNSIREEDIHHPETKLICLENAHGNGKVFDLDYMKEVYEIAKENNVYVHLDGARLFNAATHLGVQAADICQYVDSVQYCLSKGLCAPIGSILAGSKEFIDKARKNRKMMGGGMRQAGIIAAAGIISLNTMTKRLHIDHDNAKYMASKLDEINGITVDKDRLDINMVYFTIDQISSDEFVSKLLENNIKSNGYIDKEYRFVTHNDITREDIDYVIDVIKKILN